MSDSQWYPLKLCLKLVIFNFKCQMSTRFKKEKRQYLSICQSNIDVKGTLMNRACQSLNRGSMNCVEMFQVCVLRKKKKNLI